MSARQADFVTANTHIDRPPLTPEIALYLATEATPLWHATAAELDDAGAEPPFWAFAWPGGQALARYVLDHPETVRSRKVLDIGAGSGLVAIAAAMAGAAAVSANDVDAMALAAVTLNARLNGVAVTAMGDDLTRSPVPVNGTAAWDVVLAGDVFYEREMAAGIAPWLEERAAEGALVLIGDPSRAYLPGKGLEVLAAYDVPTSLDLESATTLTTRVWRVS